jgi:hypothetical protein
MLTGVTAVLHATTALVHEKAAAALDSAHAFDDPVESPPLLRSEAKIPRCPEDAMPCDDERPPPPARVPRCPEEARPCAKVIDSLAIQAAVQSVHIKMRLILPSFSIETVMFARKSSCVQKKLLSTQNSFQTNITRL